MSTETNSTHAVPGNNSTSPQIDSDYVHLDVSDWDPPPKSKKKVATQNEVTVDGSPRHIASVTIPVSSHKHGMAYEVIIQQVEEKIKALLLTNEYLTYEPRPLLKFVQRQTRYNPDVVLNKRIVEKIVRVGIAHVFLSVWRSVNSVDVLARENFPAFKNLQTTLSIVWNCTDKSASLCDSLIRCGVIQLFLSELDKAKLRESDLAAENDLYLVKAYLGILHNLVRLCPDCRSLFRTANAVTILRLYLDREPGLVKTKAYLVLSYIINDEENDLINATDENIAFILSILREALESENHFSQTHAFWAVEIACGLNHMAINDSNKARMGRLGAFPLYLKLLQSENPDEQNLGTAGLWILSFSDANKHQLKEDAECLEALQSLAGSSQNESIRRAARGALWVVKTVPPSPQCPEKPAADTVSDADVPHIMVSYHWAAQSTMRKVTDTLRAAGFKVWMDLDNMSGSTLEAMALAVERAAVILVCMSQGYKDSPNCRTEAEYTYRLHKDIVPLVLQEGYVPDGWLGLLVGTRLHFDLSQRDHVTSQTRRLIKELGQRGRVGAGAGGAAAGGTVVIRESPRSRESPRPPSGQGSTDQSWESLEGPNSHMASSTSISSLHSYMGRVTKVATWGVEDVQSWLASLELSSLVPGRLEHMDGPLLLQYKKMYDKAPAYFYHTLEDLVRLDLVAILQFTKALDSLK